MGMGGFRPHAVNRFKAHFIPTAKRRFTARFPHPHPNPPLEGEGTCSTIFRGNKTLAKRQALFNKSCVDTFACAKPSRRDVKGSGSDLCAYVSSTAASVALPVFQHLPPNQPGKEHAAFEKIGDQTQARYTCQPT